MLDDNEIKKLLLRAAARDEGSANAFERLYGLCAPLLLGVAQRIVGRRELAEEVLHDAFATIWRNAETFDRFAAQPVAWMVAIARNRALDTQREDRSGWLHAPILSPAVETRKAGVLTIDSGVRSNPVT